ncbi:hypothetical protein U0C82_16660 [Fulvimarina sp. 2208YS6-2-32]|uniref:Uncharacterized protein n=1 Tax=Fulvimarina uroteuthidis TaxID=3098149 RepID=A0ABU5I5X1_9HYPH|nr:hypothetical protein [Fulvimarina sp. 2208YS6-2-32]MDY8110774.1 hypothetical protein [Fulvimarina sp. 2208YS6-2-32]
MNHSLAANAVDTDAKAAPKSLCEVSNRLNHLGILHENEYGTNCFRCDPLDAIIKTTNRSTETVMGEHREQSEHPTDDIEEDVNEAIGLVGGDARVAVRGLILGQRQLQSEIAATVSAGYVRRKPQKRNV